MNHFKINLLILFVSLIICSLTYFYKSLEAKKTKLIPNEIRNFEGAIEKYFNEPSLGLNKLYINKLDELYRDELDLPYLSFYCLIALNYYQESFEENKILKINLSKALQNFKTRDPNNAFPVYLEILFNSKNPQSNNLKRNLNLMILKSSYSSYFQSLSAIIENKNLNPSNYRFDIIYNCKKYIYFDINLRKCLNPNLIQYNAEFLNYSKFEKEKFFNFILKNLIEDNCCLFLGMKFYNDISWNNFDLENTTYKIYLARKYYELKKNDFESFGFYKDLILKGEINAYIVRAKL